MCNPAFFTPAMMMGAGASVAAGTALGKMQKMKGQQQQLMQQMQANQKPPTAVDDNPTNRVEMAAKPKPNKMPTEPPMKPTPVMAPTLYAGSNGFLGSRNMTDNYRYRKPS